MDNELLQTLLQESSARHSHLCPRQILGARIGMLGSRLLGMPAGENPGKRLLLIVESDGCFADGVEVASGCTVGHRTLRVEDYGKIAATFVDTRTEHALRIAPMLGIRRMAYSYPPDEPRHYFAQLHAYQIMPVDEMFTVSEVQLATPVEALLSRPGTRVDCDMCGEEIINGREVRRDAKTLCHSCAGQAYYRSLTSAPLYVPVFDIMAAEAR